MNDTAATFQARGVPFTHCFNPDLLVIKVMVQSCWSGQVSSGHLALASSSFLPRSWHDYRLCPKIWKCSQGYLRGCWWGGVQSTGGGSDPWKAKGNCVVLMDITPIGTFLCCPPALLTSHIPIMFVTFALWFYVLSFSFWFSLDLGWMMLAIGKRSSPKFRNIPQKLLPLQTLCLGFIFKP